MNFTQYEELLAALVAMAALMLVQLLIADVIGILRKHTPGTPVNAGHDDVLFRAARTVGNTNESIAVFILLILYSVHSGVDLTYAVPAAWSYVASRCAYAVCYYANWQLLRSLTFAVSIAALVSLLIVIVFM